MEHPNPFEYLLEKIDHSKYCIEKNNTTTTKTYNARRIFAKKTHLI
jgi:hypothetical protein